MEQYDFSNLQICKGDQESIREGVWVPFHGVELKIARFNNPKYLKRYLSALKEKKPREEALKWAMAGGILTDWRCLFAKDADTGEKVAVSFTEERAYHVLNNDAVTCDFVVNYSQNDKNYIEDGLVTLKKNCLNSSNGSASGDIDSNS